MKTLTNDELELIDIILYAEWESIQSLSDAVHLNNLCWWLFDFHKFKSWESFERSESVYFTVLDFYFKMYKEKLLPDGWYYDYRYWSDKEELFDKIKQYEWNEPYVIYFNKLFNYN